jgi:threonine synthase
VLPPAEPVSLGEGMTPLIPARRLGPHLGLNRLFIKEEGQNPTNSFKARGLSAAVSVARSLGVETIALPTAGNAGGAAAAYAAQAGLRCVVAMPSDTPEAIVLEARACGADVHLIDGLISDCGAFIAERAAAHGWYEVSTLKEPYRIEGKKTMGYELWEEMGGALPDVIVYPTGGGVGLIGMWEGVRRARGDGPHRPRASADDRRAGRRMRAHRPRFRAARRGLGQVGACRDGCGRTASAQGARRLPHPRRHLCQRRRGRGHERRGPDGGVPGHGAPRGHLCGARRRRRPGRDPGPRREKKIARDDSVVLFNTGSGYKYLEAWRAALPA